MYKKQEFKNTLLNLGIDLAHAETEEQCREVDMKALKAIKEFEQSTETGQVDAIVSGTMIVSAGNATRALSALISGVVNGKRKNLLEIDLRNAKDQIEVVTNCMQKYH